MSKNLDKIREAISIGLFRYSKHAVEQRVNRHISHEEIAEAICSGEIIEQYPHDKYGPSCLIFGKTKEGRPLHVQCSLSPTVVIITVYEPDPLKWIDHKKRRNK